MPSGQVTGEVWPQKLCLLCHRSDCCSSDLSDEWETPMSWDLTSLHLQVLLKNSLHHFPVITSLCSLQKKSKVCHFCNNTGNVVFQLLTNNMLESPFSYTEKGVPGHPKIPQIITVICQWFHPPCLPAQAYTHVLHGFTISLLLEVQGQDSK